VSAPLLESAYRSSLRLATQHGLETIAFPAISCGVFGEWRRVVHLRLSRQLGGAVPRGWWSRDAAAVAEALANLLAVYSFLHPAGYAFDEAAEVQY
jgi:hypothetical protein